MAQHADPVAGANQPILKRHPEKSADSSVQQIGQEPDVVSFDPMDAIRDVFDEPDIFGIFSDDGRGSLVVIVVLGLENTEDTVSDWGVRVILLIGMLMVHPVHAAPGNWIHAGHPDARMPDKSIEKPG